MSSRSEQLEPSAAAWTRFLTNEVFPLVRAALQHPPADIGLTKNHHLMVISKPGPTACIMSINTELGWVQALLRALKRPAHRKLYLVKAWGVMAYAMNTTRRDRPVRYIELEARTLVRSAEAFRQEYERPGQLCYFIVAISQKK